MKIKKQVLMSITAHARKDAPLEACGYLAGRNEGVTKYYPLTNIDRSTEHFSFDPHEQFATVKHARSTGLKLLAVYHSHPISVASPSAEDVRLASDPQLSFVIISLAHGKEDVKSFKILEKLVQSEFIEVV